MNIEAMKSLCCVHKNKLKDYIKNYLEENGYKVISKKKYIIAFHPKFIPVCLIAHVDTVFNRKINPEEFYYDQEKQVLWNPGGSGFDDRAGIYIILAMVERGYHPYIIITDEEEIGGIGAQKLISNYKECPFYQCRALIQLDRANKRDCVFYDCDNKDFISKIEEYGFTEDIGSFSDISFIAPAWKIAAVNLSVGYEDEHTGMERLHCDWCDETIDKVEVIMASCSSWPFYKYIPFKYDLDFIQSKCYICGRGDFVQSDAQIIKTKDPVTKMPIGMVICPHCYKQYF